MRERILSDAAEDTLPATNTKSQSSVQGSSDPEAAFSQFQITLWSLLERQVCLYTMGESSSLPEYEAYQLLSSVCYVLGVSPTDYDVAVVSNILGEGIDVVYKRRLHALEEKTRQVKALWKRVSLAMPLIKSVALRDTLHSLKDFPARYEPRFFAHEVPADIDYPLSCPVSETLQGVDYVTTYLRQLLTECLFMQRFDLVLCQRVLGAIHPDYGELIINVFEPVATNAIGCALAGCPVSGLLVDEAGYARIAVQFEGATPSRKEVLLLEAANKVCESRGFRDESKPVHEAVQSVAQNLLPRLDLALQHHTLDRVFVSF